MMVLYVCTEGSDLLLCTELLTHNNYSQLYLLISTSGILCSIQIVKIHILNIESFSFVRERFQLNSTHDLHNESTTPLKWV